MKHHGRGTQFKNLIGESYCSEERKGIGGYTPNELRQIQANQRGRAGIENTWKVDKLNIQIGTQDGLVWSC